MLFYTNSKGAINAPANKFQGLRTSCFCARLLNRLFILFSLLVNSIGKRLYSVRSNDTGGVLSEGTYQTGVKKSVCGSITSGSAVQTKRSAIPDFSCSLAKTSRSQVHICFTRVIPSVVANAMRREFVPNRF